jgi:anti-sigma28 factor (negative regulator of flagellin synthesis)
VLDIYELISKSESDDVRWEKVKQFKLVLTNGAYPVPPEQVAARLIEEMLGAVVHISVGGKAS